MPIRRATSDDLPAIAELCVAAFYDDELYGDLMHPLREKFPSDFEAFWIRRIRESWYDWNHVWCVATTQEQGKEVVVGAADWDMMGTVGDKYRLNNWDPRHAILPFIRAFHNLNTTIHPNRAANPNPKLANPLHDAFPFFAHHWSGARANSVYLELLGIHPQYQGRGFAKELLEWGMDKAREEGVSTSLTSSMKGNMFYRKMGYTTEVGKCTEGEGNPVASLDSGWILFIDP
ncbi:acyl-CoA N-acyltransferase [Dendryphion nanum]|uniref:Acyl-CoA N-acyltransferase n=1 Tax=Dendryphion nanum TaxID=256645 RepID=A0A9P9E6D4_9PLEO|nr:acyl-CoA N-acyltransferase [Dendryphion nanum]